MSETELKAQVALQEAILEVYEAVGYVQKQRASGLNYTIATEADFIAVLRPAMVKAGLTIHCESYNIAKDETFTTKSGGTSRRIVVEAKFVVTHKGGGIRRVSSIGEANDSGDKASPKAQTIAQKYALRQLFLIETGDDPDVVPAEKHEAAPREQQNSNRQPQQTQQNTANAAPKTVGLIDKILDSIKASTSLAGLDAIREKYQKDRDVDTLPNYAAAILKLEGNYFIRRMNISKTQTELDACRLSYVSITNKDESKYFVDATLKYLETTYYACKEKIAKATEQSNTEDEYPG